MTLTALVTLAAFPSACSKSKKAQPVQNVKDPGKPKDKVTSPDEVNQAILRYQYQPGTLAADCAGAIAVAGEKLDEIAAIEPAKRTFDNTVVAMERIESDLQNFTSPMAFMRYVSLDKNTRKESVNCDKSVTAFFIETGARADLYAAVKDMKAPANDADAARLLSETLIGFEQNGLSLPEDQRAKMTALQKEVKDLESKFNENLTNDDSKFEATADDLKGLAEGALAKLKKSDAGKFIITDENYGMIQNGVSKAETRKKMEALHLNKGTAENAQLFAQAVAKRAQIAKIMGYKTWADYQTKTKMVGTGKAALDFLTNLKDKLSKGAKADIDRMKKAKAEDPDAAGDATFNQWDIRYYSHKIQSKEYKLDDDKVAEYFPIDKVLKGLFEAYSKILGVEYQEVKDAKVWQPDVKLFKTIDAKSKELIGYFFMDLYPRENKYDWFAAWNLVNGRKNSDGSYQAPIAAIVGNWPKPEAGKPALLSHGDVETMFHEFGHVMHNVLTKAKYGTMSGTAVKQDFVEAPSQMLENWVWNADILNLMGEHYKDKTALPADLLKQMIASKNFNVAYLSTRQLYFGLFDLLVHTQEGADPDAIQKSLHEELFGIAVTPDTHMQGSFGHLMGGYDAGYYGYLYSKAFASDMFTRFAPDKLLSPEVGADYRKFILEPGNMEDPMVLIKKFLGRDFSYDPFYRELGIL